MSKFRAYILVILLATSCGGGTSGTGTMIDSLGKLQNMSGNPVAGVEIQAETSKGAASVVTDSNGDYFFQIEVGEDREMLWLFSSSEGETQFVLEDIPAETKEVSILWQLNEEMEPEPAEIEFR